MSDVFDRIRGGFAQITKKSKSVELAELGDVAHQSLVLLNAPTIDTILQGEASLDGQKKEYVLRATHGRREISRPIRKDLFIADPEEFRVLWNSLSESLNRETLSTTHHMVNETIYTAVTSFAVVQDLFKPSRKVPGTYFELLISSLLIKLTGYSHSKQIALPDTDWRVPTDFVLNRPDGKRSLVIPTKITTRERIVQPWAHQRILSDVYGDKYRSILVCVSELQRDKDAGINEVCVPGQVKGYQKHLAQMSGMYYLDPPAKYANADFQKVLPVKPLNCLFQGDLKALFDSE